MPELEGEKVFPSVSILVKLNKDESMSVKAVKSLLTQTFQDFEIIIIDDGLNKNCFDKIKQLGSEKISWIEAPGNPSVQWNAGIKASKGEYISFLDGTQEWIEDKLEKQIEIFRNASPKLGMVYTNIYKAVNPDDKYFIPIPEGKQPGIDFYDFLTWRNIVSSSTLMIRKKCFEKAGMFDEEIPCMHQWDLIVRMSMHYEYEVIDEPLVIENDWNNIAATDPQKIADNWQTVFVKNNREFMKNKVLLAKRYERAGEFLFINNVPIWGRKYLLKAASAAFPNRIWQHMIAKFLLGRKYYDLKRFIKNMLKKS